MEKNMENEMEPRGMNDIIFCYFKRLKASTSSSLVWLDYICRMGQSNQHSHIVV